MGAGGDPEFGEAAVEVRADRARGEEEPFADLAVGQPARGEPDDLPLLRGEFGERVGGRAAGVEPGGTRLGPGPFGPRVRAQAPEGLQRLGERTPRLGDPAAAPQPLGQVEQGLRVLEGPVLPYRIGQRRPEVRLRLLGVRQQATGPADQRGQPGEAWPASAAAARSTTAAASARRPQRTAAAASSARAG